MSDDRNVLVGPLESIVHYAKRHDSDSRHSSEANEGHATFVMAWLANARRRMASTFGTKAY